jgi:hypothetical protein
VRICRFDHDRIGVVRDNMVTDVTDLFDTRPIWPLPKGDWIIRQMEVMPRFAAALADRRGVPLDSVRLESPVAGPGKIVGAPMNYKAHIEEANADQEISHGKTYGSVRARARGGRIGEVGQAWIGSLRVEGRLGAWDGVRGLRFGGGN